MKTTTSGFETKRIASAPDAIAPDGSEVRVLCQLSRGGLATFTLPPQAVSRAVAHHTVEEIWYILSGSGRIWRKRGDQQEVVALTAGVSLTIPTGTHFQFRCDGDHPLEVIGATMPPWPGEEEAYFVQGPWQPRLVDHRF
jgi:mannose-6-phosphate isomerase-like protein (cupin superfamily)